MWGKALAASGVLAAALVGKRAWKARSTKDAQASRWRSVSISVAPDQVAPGGKYPQPLDRLGDAVEVKVAAAGSWGSELSARPIGKTSSAEDVRQALRQSKMLLETGEILRNDPVPHGERPSTPAGLLVDQWEKHASGKGIL